MDVRCPLCFLSFPKDIIENHASACLATSSTKSDPIPDKLVTSTTPVSDTTPKVESSVNNKTDNTDKITTTTTTTTTITENLNSNSDRLSENRPSLSIDDADESGTKLSAKECIKKAKSQDRVENDSSGTIQNSITCSRCKKPVTSDQLYIMDSCNHKFCRKCLTHQTKKFIRRQIRSMALKHIEDDKKRYDLSCYCCRTPFTDNDVMCLVSVDQYTMYQIVCLKSLRDLYHPNQKVVTIECKDCQHINRCKSPLDIVSNDILARVLSGGIDKTFTDIVENTQSTQSLKDKASKALITNCSKCKTKFCRSCYHKVTDKKSEGIHNCSIITSAIIYEIVTQLASAIQQNYSLDFKNQFQLFDEYYCPDYKETSNVKTSPKSKDTTSTAKGAKQSETTSKKQKVKSKKKGKAAILPIPTVVPKNTVAGTGFAGVASESYTGLDKAQKQENDRRKLISDLIEFLIKFLPDGASQVHASLFPLLRYSSLIDILFFFLRNDWLMDASKQESQIYFSVLNLIQKLSAHPALVALFFINNDDSKQSSAITTTDKVSKNLAGSSPEITNDQNTLFYQIESLRKQAGFFLKQIEQFGTAEDSDATNLIGLALDINTVTPGIADSIDWWKQTKYYKYSNLTNILNHEYRTSLSKYFDNNEKPKKKSVSPFNKLLKKTSSTSNASSTPSKKKSSKKSKSSKSSKSKKLVKVTKDADRSPTDDFASKYCDTLRPFQFAFLSEFPKSLQKVNYLPVMSTAYANAVTTPAVLMRLSQELSSLATSLPLNDSSSVFMRVDENRINVIRFIIIGPVDTPYENGCFEFEMVVGNTYPNRPPACQIMTTGNGVVRFNPNLYNTGKICLSLLGTWSGPGWDPKVSTLLQVIVSIQSLILVPKPYFNEPGYQRSEGTSHGEQASERYNNNIRLQTLKWAMIDQIKQPTPGFEEVIHNHFKLKRDYLKKQIARWDSKSSYVILLLN